MWFLQATSEPKSIYNVPIALDIRGQLDWVAFDDAIGDVVSRHESLRTIFPIVDGTPMQRVLGPEEVHRLLHVERVTVEQCEDRLSQIAKQGFDLSLELPIRMTRLEINSDHSVVAIVFHHIAYDAQSAEPFFSDLESAYSARSAGRPPEWLPLKGQYRDFARWQVDRWEGVGELSGLQERHVAFWRRYLLDLPAAIELPVDRRGHKPTSSGSAVTIHLPANVWLQIEKQRAAARCTRFMLAQVALS